MASFIPVYQPDLSGRELEYITDCVKSSWISSLGKYVERFEAEFAAFCGVKHAVSVANGTVALHLALALRGLGPGDEVIVPTLTFAATANAVHYTGAKPVFVDCDCDTWTMDPVLVAEKITPRTKAIVPVHLYGHPVDMDPIMALAQQHDLFVVEDAAEAHGAEYRGRRVGGIGHIGGFSFYANKVITTGEGGMLTTDDPDLAQRAHFLKDHAMSKDKRYYHPVVGFNYRMTNMQAAIGLAQLERVDAILARKIQIAKLYHEGLADCPGVVRHPQAAWAKNIYWMYSILVTDESALGRDQLMAALREQGIDSRPFFYPMHQLPPYKGDGGQYPVADDLAARGINLPSYPALAAEDVGRICDTIRKLCSK